MYSLLKRKSRTVDTVVYRYGISEPAAPSDGEVSYEIGSDKSQLLKPATGDIDGRHAQRWVMPYLRRVVLRRGCPEEYMLAFG